MRLKEVADLLVTAPSSAVPVVDDAGLVGIVSEADLVPLELAPTPRPTSSRRPICPPSFESGRRGDPGGDRLPEDADLAEAGRLLLERRIKSIPIVRGRRVVGIVARRDLLAVLARRDQDIAGDLEGLLAAGWGRRARTG